jgi:hypothetical protein
MTEGGMSLSPQGSLMNGCGSARVCKARMSDTPMAVELGEDSSMFLSWVSVDADSELNTY